MIKFSSSVIYRGKRQIDSLTDYISRKDLSGLFYAVCINADVNSRDLFEIFEYKQLFKTIYISKSYIVAGLADNYNEAVELVVSIIEEYVSSRIADTGLNNHSRDNASEYMSKNSICSYLGISF